jgi:hypothetical protein
METIEIESKDIDIAKYKKRSAYLKDVKNLIKHDCLITKNGVPTILYMTLPGDITKNLRWAVKNTKYHEGKRARGLKSTSRIFGYAPRVAMRHNFCHTTSMANESPKQHHVVSSFAEYVSDVYKEYFPDIYNKHDSIVDEKVLPEWKIKGSVFTSGIINKNNPLKYHFDSGNFKGVMSNMIAFKKDVVGGHLAIPEFDVALEIADNSLTIFNGQEILHGVTGFEKKNEHAYRYTVVYYSLEQMWKCEPIDDEVLRVRSVQQKREKTRIDPKHLEDLKKQSMSLRSYAQDEYVENVKKNTA